MLINLIISTLACIGLHESFQEGMIFGKLGSWIYSIIGPTWSKPLFKCLTCMASFWGTIIYVTCFYEYDIFLHLLFVIALAGLNHIASVLFYD